MGLTAPPLAQSVTFQEVLKEGEPFVLEGIRLVEASSEVYGKGKMVLLTVKGQEKELSVWGQYLTAQAEAAEPADFGALYCLTRGVIEGYSRIPAKHLHLLTAAEVAAWEKRRQHVKPTLPPEM